MTDSPVKQFNIISLLRELIKFQLGVANKVLPDELLGAVVELEGKLRLSVFQSYPQAWNGYAVQSLQSHFIRNYAEVIHDIPPTGLDC